MTPTHKNVHMRFKLDDVNYKYDQLADVAYSFVKEGLPYQQELGNFLLDWLDDNDHITVKTSGSTGKPKQIKVKKQAMVNSALATGDFFNLRPGSKVLHCLPANFIAGKMMIVRAIILGLELDMVAPAVQPHIDYEKDYEFSAFTPMQLKYFAKYLKSIKTVIVGGGRVSKHIVELVKDKKTNVYETFGMTETVSHIAVKKLNNFNETDSGEYFTTLPNIKVAQDQRGCLVVDAPKLSAKKIVTNDMVNIISETSFEWLGRLDNMVNSGGVKLFPEEIEKKLQDKIPCGFFLASQADDTLGEKLILILEADSNALDDSVFNGLDKYEKPKAIYAISKFTETPSGKIHRTKTLQALKLI